MRHSFTPAAERALHVAAHWTLHPTGEPQIDKPQLLLGLLSETECRAAMILFAAQVDAAKVNERFRDLREVADAGLVNVRALLTRDVEEGLALVASRWVDRNRSSEFATEHLLLALLLTDDETSRWLAERGLTAVSLQPEIEQRDGQSLIDAPLDLPAEDVVKTWHFLAPTSESTIASIAVWRVIDASANRAREGLRVIEDYVRFVLDDALLTRKWKQLRHDLSQTLEQFDMSHRLAARDTVADVGTSISTTQEQTRSNPAMLAAANISRLQEALRSLEEYAKLIDPTAAQACEQLRYRSYTLQRATEITMRRGVELASARLYVLIDGRATLAEFEKLVRELVQAGVDVLQLRDKQLDDRRLLERARRLRALTRDTSTRFIMNDRADLAVLANADGVHVGQEELSVKDARTIVGPSRLVGVSTHSLEQAQQAVLDGADYIGVGPTFPSHTKTFDNFPGLALLQAVAGELRLPAFAIGGIHLKNLDEVLATGIHRVAVSAAVVNQPQPGTAAREFLARLK